MDTEGENEAIPAFFLLCGCFEAHIDSLTRSRRQSAVVFRSAIVLSGSGSALFRNQRPCYWSS